MSLAGVELTSDAPPRRLSTRRNTFPSFVHKKSTTTTTNSQISTHGVMDGMFPVSTPLIYREREKSAMEQAAAGSTPSTFISAPATSTTPAAASGPSGPAPRAAERRATAPRRGTPMMSSFDLLRPSHSFLPVSVFPSTITSYLDGPHFAYDKTSAFNYSTPVTPESYQTLLTNECRLSEINIGRNVSFFL